MSDNTIRSRPKSLSLWTVHSGGPPALPSPTGSKRANLPEVTIPPARGPKTVECPGHPKARGLPKAVCYDGVWGVGTKLGQWAG